MRVLKYLGSFLVVIFLVYASTVSAEIRLPSVLSDFMVIQQKMKIPVWGKADPGEKVWIKGSWQWFGTSTVADNNGD